MPAMPASVLHAPVLDWYAENARDLPWRRPEASAWAVLVSEFMLQQTPVSRVLPVWCSWMQTWPRASDLAAVTAGAAIRAWGSLGYPRRALRLHAAAAAIRDQHGGEVPGDYAALRRLPGVGDYTAAAVASFAFGSGPAVLDTNVRRVLARALDAKQFPGASVTSPERVRATSLLPEDALTASRWSVAVMELGALVCTARAPRCQVCPVASRCSWRLAGKPAYDGPARRRQPYAGTDRQCRGRLLAALRTAAGPVSRRALGAVWEQESQRERALNTLVADGLVERLQGDAFALPG